MKHIVVLGAGTGGTLIANKLVRVLDESWQVTVVDRDDRHIYQPGLLFVPFGMNEARDLVRSRRRLLDPQVRLLVSEIDRVDPAAKTVALADGQRLPYDLLVVATGTRIRPELTPGLDGPGWFRNTFDFYTLEGSVALASALEGFTGRLVVNIVEMPIKCPVAPLEFAFLADAYFTERGTRNQVEIVYATPLDGAFTKPTASRILGGLLEQRGIYVVPNFGASEVDTEGRVLKSYDGRQLPYDLLVSVPLHGGAQAMSDSGLGDPLGFVPTDKHTLQSKAFPEIFVIGDATDLPTSKAGAVAHFQGDTLLPNLLRFIDRRPLDPSFDGHANCFIETGFGKAMLLDFNYETEPLPGRFPLPGVGPFTLLEESHANHWGKMAFRWAYWNVLVKGDELPLDAHMHKVGKWGVAA